MEISDRIKKNLGKTLYRIHNEYTTNNSNVICNKTADTVSGYIFNLIREFNTIKIEVDNLFDVISVTSTSTDWIATDVVNDFIFQNVSEYVTVPEQYVTDINKFIRINSYKNHCNSEWTTQALVSKELPKLYYYGSIISNKQVCFTIYCNEKNTKVVRENSSLITDEDFASFHEFIKTIPVPAPYVHTPYVQKTVNQKLEELWV